MQILQFHYNLIFLLNYNILQTKPGSVSQSTEVDTTENLANGFSITKAFHNLHKLLPQWIFMCNRTVNKYEFIKRPYLCILPFL